jgi:hypothetical protein
MSTPPTPPEGGPDAVGGDAQPPDAGASVTSAPDREPSQRKLWLWPLFAAIIVLVVLGAIIADNNKSKPSTVVNQQSTSTVNSLGVTVPAPQTNTTTVTAPTTTVTAPAKTVTAAPTTVTAPAAPATAPTTTKTQKTTSAPAP